MPRACALPQEKPLRWNACALQLESSCHSPQLEKAHMQQQRPAAAKSPQSCPTLCDPIDSISPGSPIPGDSPGKNTGVGCHFLLQCMKVKSQSEVVQSCPTLSDPMNYSPPGFSIHGIFQARVLEWGAIAFSQPRPSTTPKKKSYIDKSNTQLTKYCIFLIRIFWCPIDKG